MINILKKLKLNYVLIGAIFLLSSFSLYQKQRADRAEKDVETYKTLSNNLMSVNQGLLQYDNKLGNIVSAVNTISARDATFKQLVGEVHTLRDSFDGVKRNLRNVSAVMNSGFEATRTFITESKSDTTYVLGSDTTKAWAFKDGDQYFSIRGLVIPDRRTVVATPSFSGDFTGILIEKRGEPKRRFLGIGIGKKTERFELTSTNPYLKIDSLSFIKRK